MKKLLNSFIGLINKEISNKKKINADLSIESQFDEIFSDADLIAAAIKFEMHHGVEIPDDYMVFTSTFRELIKKISKLPKISPNEMSKFIRQKQKMLDGVLQDLYDDKKFVEIIKKSTAREDKTYKSLKNIRIKEEKEVLDFISDYFNASVISRLLKIKDDKFPVFTDMRANYIQLTDKMGGDIYSICREVSEILGLTDFPVEFYVENKPQVNAFSYHSYNTKQPHFITLNSGLLNVFSGEELKFVIGHEFGHLIYEHLPFKRIVDFIYPDQLPPSLLNVFDLWQKLSEMSCDRIGLLAINDLDAAVTANFKLSSGLHTNQFNLSAHILASAAEQTVNEVAKKPYYVFDTHPAFPIRTRAIELFYHSQTRKHFMDHKEYKKDNLLSKKIHELAEMLKLKPIGGQKQTELDFLASAGYLIMTSSSDWNADKHGYLINILSQYCYWPPLYLDILVKEDNIHDVMESISSIIVERFSFLSHSLFKQLIPLITRDKKVSNQEIETLFSIAEKIKIPSDVANDYILVAESA
ncbi:MAG: M48 family metallopeptidase [Proteobacteria bacterium]|nr:M48 family metallopeptidase [Pseudomonadota bacterium]